MQIKATQIKYVLHYVEPWSYYNKKHILHKLQHNKHIMTYFLFLNQIKWNKYTLKA